MLETSEEDMRSQRRRRNQESNWRQREAERPNLSGSTINMAAAGSRPTQETQERRNSKLTTAEMDGQRSYAEEARWRRIQSSNGEMKAGKSCAAYAAHGQQNAKPRYIAQERQYKVLDGGDGKSTNPNSQEMAKVTIPGWEEQ